MEGKIPNTVKEPDIEYGVYSYAEYLTWQMDEVVELIKGKVFKKAAAAPKRIHQKVSGEFYLRLGNYLKGQTCQVYSAPYSGSFYRPVEIPPKPPKGGERKGLPF